VTNAGIVAILMVFKSNLGVLIYENRQRPNTKKWHTRILIGAFALTIASCTTEQIQTGVDILNETAKGVNGPPDSSTVAAGLKEALKKGAKSGGETLSKPDGFLKNQAIKILFPPEFKSAESKLRQLGMGKLADQAITSFNRSAEKASQKAYPILASAITQMTIADAMNILLGPKDAATNYLKKTTTTQLQGAFFPVVKESADKVHATKYWDTLATMYNQIPFVKPVPDDINKYITSKTVAGLFHVTEKEEASIRENPMARTSNLVKRVFNYADEKKSNRQ
jgi:hypothetical protein